MKGSPPVKQAFHEKILKKVGSNMQHHLIMGIWGAHPPPIPANVHDPWKIWKIKILIKGFFRDHDDQ